MAKIYNIKSLRRLSLVGLFSFLTVLSFGQALVNNPCGFAGANQWPLDGTCYNVSTAGMTPLFNPGSCNSSGVDDGWGWFVGDGNAITVAFNPGNAYDPVLHVYDATAGCGAIVFQGCSDNCCNNANESVAFGSVLGNIYIIRLQDWNSNATMTGCLSVTTTGGGGGGGGGDDCANADRIDCGDPVLVGETSVGNTNDQGSYTCHTTGAPFFTPIATPGGDHYYVVQWPDAANGGAIRINLTNVVDGNDTYLELIALGNPCAPPACDDGGQLTIATGLFGTATNFLEYNVGAGVADYYFVVDSQNDGIDSYDIEVTCFTTGLELDVTNGCAAIPAGQPANQGYYQTWDGAAPPATQDPALMTGTYTICENVYIMNVGWEWLKYFDVTLGACWTNPTNFTPNGNNTGFHSLCGGAATGTWNANLAGNVISWDFTHPTQGGCGNPAWGDGNLLNNNYTCQLYTFCYDANVDPACNANTGFQNGVSATDDGIGAGAGSGVNPSNITLGTTSPTVLPVTLVSFTAQAVLNEGKYGVILNWRTAAEINNDFFTIERSTDGINFEYVLEMPGAGNSTSINNYITVDEDPYKGVSYYRLKQTDFNGASEYFDMVSVNISNIDDLTLFPNPVTSDLNISLKSKSEQSEIYVKIYNIQGSLIVNQKNALVKGLNEIAVDMNKYSQGLYFVTVEYGNQIQKLKFLKE